MTNSNFKKFVYDCIICTLDYFDQDSFLWDTLKNNFLGYVGCNNSSKLRKKDNIRKNISKLEKSLSNKKVDLDGLKELLSNIECNSKRDKNKSLECLNSGLYEFINYLMEEYFKLDEKSLEDNKILLPILAKKKEKKIELVKMNDADYYYANISYKKSTKSYMVDNKSFSYEVDKYKEALFENKENVFDDEDVLLSTFEKSRRIFVDSMLHLEKEMNSIIMKDVDITFPVVDIFNIALELLNCLYKEITYGKNRVKALDDLMKMSFEAYGFKRQISKYKEMIEHINLNLVDLDVSNEIMKLSNELIKSVKYREFKGSNNILPSASDIVKALNTRVYDDLIKNGLYLSLEKLVDYLGYYDVEMVIDLYNDLVLNAKNYGEDVTKTLVGMQKKICLLLGLKDNIYAYSVDDFEEKMDGVCSEFLKEKKMFKVSLSDFKIYNSLI